jgi:hypothetical protein
MYICTVYQRLNMELDLQSFFGLNAHSCTHWPRPHKPLPQYPFPHLVSYTRALLVSQDRRHLFVTPDAYYVSTETLCSTEINLWIYTNTTLLFSKDTLHSYAKQRGLLVFTKPWLYTLRWLKQHSLNSSIHTLALVIIPILQRVKLYSYSVQHLLRNVWQTVLEFCETAPIPLHTHFCMRRRRMKVEKCKIGSLKCAKNWIFTGSKE